LSQKPNKINVAKDENDVGTLYIIMVSMKRFVPVMNKTLIFRPLEFELISTYYIFITYDSISLPTEECPG